MSEFEGPTVQVFQAGRAEIGPVKTRIRQVIPGEGRGEWQYGLVQGDKVITLEGVPRIAARNLVRRWMVPATGWREVHDVDL